MKAYENSAIRQNVSFMTFTKTTGTELLQPLESSAEFNAVIKSLTFLACRILAHKWMLLVKKSRKVGKQADFPFLVGYGKLFGKCFGVLNGQASVSLAASLLLLLLLLLPRPLFRPVFFVPLLFLGCVCWYTTS